MVVCLAFQTMGLAFFFASAVFSRRGQDGGFGAGRPRPLSVPLSSLRRETSYSFLGAPARARPGVVHYSRMCLGPKSAALAVALRTTPSACWANAQPTVRIVYGAFQSGMHLPWPEIAPPQQAMPDAFRCCFGRHQWREPPRACVGAMYDQSPSQTAWASCPMPPFSTGT